MLRSVVRTLSFFSQWMAEVVRQPMLMATLVLGPFLILLLFGQGEQFGAPQAADCTRHRSRTGAEPVHRPCPAQAVSGYHQHYF
jgi:hypothetical protein